jgi:nicotinamide riboside kinase
MKVINLIGASNTGKSTTVYGLLYMMKRMGLSVEYASEYAKDMVYEQRGNILGDQLYILAKQQRKLSRLDNIDYAVTDTSLLLGIVYATNPLPELVDVVKAYFNAYDNIVFYLPRNDRFKFQGAGRVQQNTAESDSFIPKIESVLPEGTICLEKADDYVMPILEHLGLAEEARKVEINWGCPSDWWCRKTTYPATPFSGPHIVVAGDGETAWCDKRACKLCKMEEFGDDWEISEEYSDLHDCDKTDLGYHCSCYDKGKGECCQCERVRDKR